MFHIKKFFYIDKFIKEPYFYYNSCFAHAIYTAGTFFPCIYRLKALCDYERRRFLYVCISFNNMFFFTQCTKLQVNLRKKLIVSPYFNIIRKFLPICFTFD